jgi:adenylate cyclase
LSVRIGGHFGKAVVSRLGGAHHQHITATGDTVNVASRLLEVAKQQASPIIFSEDLYEAAAAPPALAEGEKVANVQVTIRGRHQPLKIRAWRIGS